MRKVSDMSWPLLDQALHEIRDYTQQHPELRAAHHFVYDLPLGGVRQKPSFIVMGINPGETDHCWDSYPGPTEQSWAFDYEESGKLGPSRGGRKWRDTARFFTNGLPVVLAELFFWSSSNSAQFEDRFGSLWQSKHLPFCIEKIKLLIDCYKPEAVIFPGVTFSENIAGEFNLDYIAGQRDQNNGDRLVEHYIDAITQRPWFFTKHWSGSFGFSNSQKCEIKRYIDPHLG